MCLFVKEGEEPKIATKDIVCYKCVGDYGKYWKPCMLIGSMMFSYPYNKVLTAESYSYIKGEAYSIQHLKIEDCFVLKRIINEGFHAKCKKVHTYEKRCVIPKGTEYCLGKSNDIVAVNMIVFKSTLDYYWYRIKKLWQK